MNWLTLVDLVKARLPENPSTAQARNEMSRVIEALGVADSQSHINMIRKVRK